jgi:hypothetical protein
MYIAQIRNKAGRLLLEGPPHENRDDAARLVFAAGPQTSKVCSTSNAYRDPAGNWQSNGCDIRWHKRDDVLRDIPKACDAGLFSDDARQADLVDLARRHSVQGQ